MPFTVNSGFKTNNKHTSNDNLILSPLPYIILCYLSSSYYLLHNHNYYPYQMRRLFSSSEFQYIRSLRVEPIPRQGLSYQVCMCQ